MESRDLVDPALRPGLAFFAGVPLTLEDLPARRAGMEAFLAAMGSAPDGVSVNERSIAASDGRMVPVVVFTPISPDKKPAVLHIHGGGFVVGSARDGAASTGALAKDAGCVVVSVDYRLAPESRYPDAIEDCYVALKWLHDEADALDVDRDRIAVAGESAGGGLAAALALLARDRGEVTLIHQHLIYPMLDDRTCLANLPPHIGEHVWTKDDNRFGWASLLGEAPGGPEVSPYAAAARAFDLAGLPSTFISVGALDLFVEEDVNYARRLLLAGVPTELHVYPGAYHGFSVVSDAPVSIAHAEASSAALRRALHCGSRSPLQT